MLSDKETVEKFLAELKDAANNGRIIPVNRKKNMQSLAKLGLTWKDAIDYIKTLTYEDYSNGPEDDRDNDDTNCMWIFMKNIENEKMYIKFKIIYTADTNIKIISFHIAER